jgi:hypothetical protein
VILTNDRLYGVQTQSGTSETQVYALDRSDGSVIAQTGFDRGFADAAYGSLNPALLSVTVDLVLAETCLADQSPLVSAELLLAGFPEN